MGLARWAVVRVSQDASSSSVQRGPQAPELTLAAQIALSLELHTKKASEHPERGTATGTTQAADAMGARRLVSPSNSEIEATPPCIATPSNQRSSVPSTRLQAPPLHCNLDRRQDDTLQAATSPFQLVLGRAGQGSGATEAATAPPARPACSVLRLPSHCNLIPPRHLNTTSSRLFIITSSPRTPPLPGQRFRPRHADTPRRPDVAALEQPHFAPDGHISRPPFPLSPLALVSSLSVPATTHAPRSAAGACLGTDRNNTAADVRRGEARRRQHRRPTCRTGSEAQSRFAMCDDLCAPPSHPGRIHRAEAAFTGD
ncbi:hypothetical protein PCL_02662 [Purpureocillium lilacinum]|uniref:Uncharacterized protein n=1 Tax=Purpureocillium lilacinum TaxID=33203 RepID=A0A2U3DZP2_PURLI|nr:hypothetical protein PCL_02662 [Purpureocillium lilacinum]